MEHLNQLEQYILTELYEQDRLPSSCKTAIGQEALRGLIARKYIPRTGEGIRTVYQITEKGLGLLDAEEIDMKEEETIEFEVVDDCHLWADIVKAVIGQGGTPETAMLHADIVVKAYKARGADIYKQAKALNKIIAEHQGGGQMTSEDGVIVPLNPNGNKEPN